MPPAPVTVEPVFYLFGPAHSTVIALTLVIPLLCILVVERTQSRRFDWAVRGSLAAVLTINFAGFAVRGCAAGTLTWQQALPFQLCDWTMIIVIVALLNGGRPRWLEVAYFWGIGGSLQAVITPNLPFGFPDYRFLTFFIDHCGIVIGLVYLLVTRRFRPRPISIVRTWIWSMVYLGVTLLVDQITGVNYGFLLHKPEAFSILSYLSDSRPIYLLQLNLLALVFFTILYLPFAIFDLSRSLRNAGKQEGIT